MKINQYTLSLISLLISSLSLSLAYVLEYFFTLMPCDLCLKQRGIHFCIILVSITNIICKRMEKKFNFLYTPLILLWITSIGLSFYHFGIEEKFWKGLSSCSLEINFDQNTLAEILSRTPVRCDEPEMKIFNLSFSGWNSLISLSTFIFLLYIIYQKKKDKQ